MLSANKNRTSPSTSNKGSVPPINPRTHLHKTMHTKIKLIQLCEWHQTIALFWQFQLLPYPDAVLRPEQFASYFSNPFKKMEQYTPYNIFHELLLHMGFSNLSEVGTVKAFKSGFPRARCFLQ
jgi:hypothetical protein